MFKIKKFRQSMELLEKIKDNPKRKFDYHIINGKVLMEMKEYSEAVENLLERDRIYKGDTGLLNTLGFCYYKTGYMEKALEIL